jgi:hypothetical protein
MPMLLLLGCGGGFDYEGTPGQPVPARFDSWVPSVAATVDDATEVDLLVDTGAPYTFLDSGVFTDYEEGTAEVDLEAFALRFPGYPARIADVLPGAEDRWQGLIGGDLLGHFVLGIDYRGDQVWLDEDWAGPAAVDVPVDLRGTRVLVEVALEDGEPVWMMVDSGATAVVLDVGVAAALPAGRPRLDGVTATTANGTVSAYFTRVWQLAIGGADEASVAVLVVEDGTLFDALSDEVDVPVAGLVGGSFLRAYLTAVDYPGRSLHLSRYAEQDHVDADEFVRVGFALAPAGATWEVREVYPGTDAAAEGLVPGDVIAAIGGSDLAGLDADQVDALLAPYGLGDEVPVSVDRGTVEEHMIAVEDLLPRYDMP